MELIDIQALLQPISEAQPAGPDLRQDSSPSSLYVRLKDARNLARSIERANVGKKPDEQELNPHWKTILELAPKVLAESKDLEVAAWLTEALVRQHGFVGLAQGFELMTGLVSQFDHLYPSPDEDGIETTLMPITGLNGTGAPGTLIAPINSVAITDSVSGEEFSTWQYQQSADLSRAPNEKARQERIRNGVMKMETLVAAANSTPKAFYENLMTEVDASISQYNTLTKVLAEKFSHDAPPSTNIRNALAKVRKAIKTIAKNFFTSSEKESEDENGEVVAKEFGTVSLSTEVESNGVGFTNSSSTLNTTVTIQNRKAAFETLKGLSEFFKRTEPHSLLGYAIERLVRLGDLPLPELMKELMTERHAQEEFYKMAGIQPPVEPVKPVEPVPGFGGAAPGAMPAYNPPPAAPNPYGSNPYGSNPYGSSPYGADPYGPPPPPNF